MVGEFHMDVGEFDDTGLSLDYRHRLWAPTFDGLLGPSRWLKDVLPRYCVVGVPSAIYRETMYVGVVACVLVGPLVTNV